MRRPRMRIRARPDFGTTVARAGLSFAALQRASSVSKSTIFALQNPSIHATRTTGAIYPATAWKLANAYARLAQVSPDDAFAALFEEEVVQATDDSVDTVMRTAV